MTKFKNSLIAAKVTGRVTSRHIETEENTIRLLSLQPVTLFIEATRTLHQYKEGIFIISYMFIFSGSETIKLENIVFVYVVP